MDWHFIKKKLHYSWIVCFGCVLVYFCSAGLSCNLYPVYQPFLIKEFGFSQTQVALLNTIRTLANMSSLLVLTAFFKKLNLRKGLLVAGAITTAGYFVFSVARVYPMFVLGHILVGFGYGLSCMVPMSMLLERWFRKDLTLAVSICSAASGMATIGLPGLVTASIENRSLNSTFLTEAVIMTVIILLGYVIIKDRPEEMHLRPFGDNEVGGIAGMQTEEAAVSPDGARTGLSKKELIPAIIMVFFMGGICGTGWSCMSLLASTQGYSSAIMATAVTCAGAALMASKFLFGWMAEKFTLYKTTQVFHVALILGGVMLIFSGAGAWMLLLGCLIYGGAISMITVGMVSWTKDWVIPKERDGLKKTIAMAYTVGSMLCGVMPGIVADLTGSYVPAYIWFTAASVICMIIMAYTYRKVWAKNKNA